MVSTNALPSLDMAELPASYWLSESQTGYYFDTQSELQQTVLLKSSLLKSFFRKLALDEMLTFEDVILGKKNYSEPLFYKIEKSVGETFVSAEQTLVIPATGNFIKYFDTQIKPNQSYSYRVTACTLVIGNQYNYTESPSYSPNDMICNLAVENNPVIRMVEVPILEDTVNCVSDPPTPPQAIFYTKNNSDNIISIRLMTNRMESRVESFTAITDSDVFVEQVLSNKNRYQEESYFDNTNSKIMTYQVFKMSKPPSSIEDFASHKISDISENIYFGGLTYSTKLRPNEKCYYMFRSINQHGLKSNPSSIYEVELIKGSDTSRLIVNTYKLPHPNRRYQSRNMRKLVQLIPSSLHTIYVGNSDDGIDQPTVDVPNSLDKVILGIAEKPIWGKRFKIRLTSNNTGRKIDFNVVFNLIKKKTEEEMM